MNGATSILTGSHVGATLVIICPFYVFTYPLVDSICVFLTPLGSPLPPRHQRLQALAHEYLVNLTHALRVLETEPAHLSRLERETLHSAFGAIRFDEKYNHDKLNTLRLAVLEAKRHAARMLINKF